MTAAFPLQALLDLSKTRLEDATRTLGELMAKEAEGDRKLAMLKEYRNEYQARFEEAARAGLTPETWRNYSAFILRIDEAIHLQEDQVNRARQLTAAGKQKWMHERNRAKAFDTLHDRHLAAELRRQNKAEQKQADEHTANRHRQRQENGE